MKEIQSYVPYRNDTLNKSHSQVSLGVTGDRNELIPPYGTQAQACTLEKADKETLRTLSTELYTAFETDIPESLYSLDLSFTCLFVSWFCFLFQQLACFFFNCYLH